MLKFPFRIDQETSSRQFEMPHFPALHESAEWIANFGPPRVAAASSSWRPHFPEFVAARSSSSTPTGPPRTAAAASSWRPHFPEFATARSSSSTPTPMSDVAMSVPPQDSETRPVCKFGPTSRIGKFVAKSLGAEITAQLIRLRWGKCTRAGCNYARHPHIYKSGPKKGRLVLLRNGFNKTVNGSSGKRKCWQDWPFPMERYTELHSGMRKEYESLRNAFSRGSSG